MRGRLRIVAVVLAMLAAVAVIWEIAVRLTPLPAGLDDPLPVTPALADRRGHIFAVRPTALARDSRPVPLRELGPWLPLATVGIEDHRFFQHGGADFHALLAAAWRNIRNARVISGASTVTQQLIKNASERTSRTWTAKIYEMLAAARLERTWSKEKILEAYINRLDYGNRRIGPAAAAWAYFGKSTNVISMPEAIFLAGLPQSPARLNPWRNPAGAQARYRRNVARLAALDLLPAGVDAAVLGENPPRIERHDPPDEARQFASVVGPAGRPLELCTLDLDLQRVTERMLREHLNSMGSQHVGDAAVVIVENSTGHVRVLACAGNVRHGSLNAASQPRSCGSTLKPFSYLAALDERRMTAATVLPDTPDAISEKYRDYDPQNYSDHFYGPVRLREALGNSMNVPAVVALSRLGARQTFDHLRGWGLNFPQSFDAYGAGFILGNAQVRLLDLAGAYASLARGGQAWKVRLTPRDPIESRPMASKDACSIVTDILCDNRARRLSFGNFSPLHLRERTAVKTGTSSGFRDGWCVGFNGRHTVAVWTGNLDGTPMAEILAVRSAAPLWANLMNYLYAAGDPEVPALKESDSLRKVTVAAETGLLPRTGEPVIEEWFLAGTEPGESAAKSYVDGAWQLPPEYAAWCASRYNHLGAKVTGGPLQILFPRDGAVFEWNPHLPAGQQMVHFAATENCEWQINGEAKAAHPGAPMVRMKKGDWVIRAFRGGQVAESHFRVE